MNAKTSNEKVILEHLLDDENVKKAEIEIEK